MLTPQPMLTIKNWARSGLLLLVAVALFAACTPPGPRALLQGKKLLDQGKPVEAVEKLKLATSLLTSNAQAWNYLGLALHQSGQSPQAEKAYLRALALNRDLSEAHYNLGCLLLSQNRLESAKAELTAYTLRRGNPPDGLIKLGTAQLRSREFAAAERSFSDALRAKPDNAEAWTGLGVARAQRGRALEAAQCFNAALKRQPNYSPALLNLAIVAQGGLNDRALALQKYREYLALKPSPANVEAVKAIVRQLERPPAPPPRAAQTNAIPVVAQAPPPTRPAPVEAPQVVTQRVAVGTAPHTNAPKPEPPPSSHAATAATLPKPPPATNQPKPLASKPASPASSPVAKSSAPPAEPRPRSTPPAPTPVSTQVLSSVVAPAPLRVVPRTNDTRTVKRGVLKRLFGSEGKQPARPSVTSPDATATPASARYEYQNPSVPAAGNRDDAETMFAQGVEAHRANRLQEASQYYRKATQLDPSYFEAYYNLGLAASQIGDSRAAFSAYEQALAIRPGSLDARYNFALLLRQNGYYQDAANELEKVAAQFPNEPRTRLALGNLYAQQLHQAGRARVHYFRYLELEPQTAQATAIRYWLKDNSQ